MGRYSFPVELFHLQLLAGYRRIDKPLPYRTFGVIKLSLYVPVPAPVLDTCPVPGMWTGGYALLP